MRSTYCRNNAEVLQYFINSHTSSNRRLINEWLNDFSHTHIFGSLFSVDLGIAALSLMMMRMKWKVMYVINHFKTDVECYLNERSCLQSTEWRKMILLGCEHGDILTLSGVKDLCIFVLMRINSMCSHAFVRSAPGKRILWVCNVTVLTCGTSALWHLSSVMWCAPLV